jgi:GDP-4-dehydro-6-deoxy-D-mannose reductase
MPIYLITGGSGFVGTYLLKHIIQEAPSSKIIIFSSSIPKNKVLNVDYVTFNMQDTDQLTKYIEHYKPEYIFHMAAMSSVGQSWNEPSKSFTNNVNIYLNLLEAVRLTNIHCYILSVGSSEVYGRSKEFKAPLKETDSLNPISPYAVARVAQEMLSNVYINGFGLKIIMTRSFNHIGPGQDPRFVVSSFINSAVDRKRFKSRETVYVGNLSIVRDFVDVRDVVVAYYQLIHQGKIGEVYNICSGKGKSLYEITDLINELNNYPLEFIENVQLFRPDDNPIIIGDNSKIKKTIHWAPSISLEETLLDMINQYSH